MTMMNDLWDGEPLEEEDDHYGQTGTACPSDSNGIHRQVYWMVTNWRCMKCHFNLVNGVWHKRVMA